MEPGYVLDEIIIIPATPYSGECRVRMCNGMKEKKEKTFFFTIIGFVVPGVAKMEANN